MNRVKKILSFAFTALFYSSVSTQPARADEPAMPNFRPSAVPLVTADPYLSIWSEADKLTDDVTRHWTRKPQPLTSLIRIDGKTYLLMGKPAGMDIPAFPQTLLDVTPTRSIYQFDDGHLNVQLTFMTPALPDDLDVLSRPASYVTWKVHSDDGQPHAVSFCLAVSSLVAVNTPNQPVTWNRESIDGLVAMSAGTLAQPLLKRSGDDTRIDWGHVYLACAQDKSVSSTMGPSDAILNAFAAGTGLPADVASTPTAPADGEPALMLAFDFGAISNDPAERTAVVAYDEVKAIQYFGRSLQPFWRRNGATPADLLKAAIQDYPSLEKRCDKFDIELCEDMIKAGGFKYAQLAALSYRQALAGCGLAADDNGQPLIFTKENTSNGCIATVDVIFPAAPLFLFMGPTYAKALVQPAMAYGSNPQHWKYDFAPHDLGVYPQATRQVYGMVPPDAKNFSNMMPVEESGNLILLCDAIAHVDGNADYASQFWPTLTHWVEYLSKYGLDPENQLCTDDFMGHLAHNANLSVKAILAIAAYGDMARMRGDTATADKYMALAKTDVANWLQQRDADHSRNAFDKPGSWSQKYNLVWDQLLGLNVFPHEVSQQEIAWYLKQLKPYGVPLDSRKAITKADWCLWTATMADKQADFEAIVSPIWDYVSQTTTRDPIADSYMTDDVKSKGMHARPVIGGLFIKMLADPAVAKKWQSRDKFNAKNWAPIVDFNPTQFAVPISGKGDISWKFTTEKPADGWDAPGFDDSKWTTAKGAIGSPIASPATDQWDTPEVWARQVFRLPADAKPENLELFWQHYGGIDVYLNGKPAANDRGGIWEYMPATIKNGAIESLKPGAENVLAIHARGSNGHHFVDVGITTR